MARATLQGLTSRMRTPRVQEAMLAAVRKLGDNPRALELYLENLSGEQMKEMTELMRLGTTSRALKRSVDLAAQQLQAKYGPEGVEWAGLRMHERIGKEQLATETGIRRLGMTTQRETGLMDIASRSRVAGLKVATGERIAGMERAVAYPQAVLDVGRGHLDLKEKKAVSAQYKEQGKLWEAMKNLLPKKYPRDLDYGIIER